MPFFKPKAPKPPKKEPTWEEEFGPDDVDKTGDEDELAEVPSEQLFAILERAGAGGRADAASALEDKDFPETEEAVRDEVRRWLPFWDDAETDVRASCVARVAQLARDTRGPLRAELARRLAEAANDPVATIRAATMNHWGAMVELEDDEIPTAWAVLDRMARDPDDEMRLEVPWALMDWEGAVPEERRPAIFRALVDLADGDDGETRAAAVKALLVHRAECPPAFKARAEGLLAKYHAA